MMNVDIFAVAVGLWVAVASYLALDAVLALAVGRKVGGVRFLRMGRVQITFCVMRKRQELR